MYSFASQIGRWLAKRDGGIVKKQKGIAGQSLSRLTATAPFTQGSLFWCPSDGTNVRLPPRGSCRANARLKESACRIKCAQIPKSRRLLPSNAPHLPPPSRREAKATTAHPSVCHPERSRSFGEGVSRKATIRSKTEERSDEGISSGRLLSFHMMLLFLQEDTKRLSEIPRVLRTCAFACSFHSTRKSSTTASPPLRMTGYK